MVNRAGFSLTEVIVALTLLSIGLLSAAGTGFLAAHMFTQAELQERALRRAETILDSLAALPANGGGSELRYGAQITWAASDSSGVLLVRVVVTGRPDLVLQAQR